METKRFGFGIIGCGNIGPSHANAINAVADAQLIAVTDIIEDKAKSFAEKFNVKCWYTDYQEMLKRDDIDVVCICTPSGMHSEMAVAAADAKKHILCEKPLDISIEAIDKMLDAVRRNKVKLSGVFQRRTYDSSIKAREAVRSGKLGKMVLGDAYLKYYRSQEYYNSADWRGTWSMDGGGALMNQGIHGIDLIQWIMGDIESVFAKAGALARDIEVEDTAVIVVTYKNGAYGVIEGTTSVYPAIPTRLELHGEKGSIIMEEQTITKWQVIGEESKTFEGDEKVGGSSHPTDISATGHIRHVIDLISAIKEDREPAINGESAKKAVEVILAVYESARTGKEIRIDDLR